MPDEFQKMLLSDGSTTVADFIASRPAAIRRFLIAAVSDCWRRHCKLNVAEIQIAARAIRYAL